MLDMRLLRPHTHAGCDYLPDAVLIVDDATADWLLAQHIGVPAPHDLSAPLTAGRCATTHKPLPRFAATDTDTTGDSP